MTLGNFAKRTIANVRDGSLLCWKQVHVDHDNMP